MIAFFVVMMFVGFVCTFGGVLNAALPSDKAETVVPSDALELSKAA